MINRPGLRTVLSEKYLEVFGWFETELESVQKIYESQKVSRCVMSMKMKDLPMHTGCTSCLSSTLLYDHFSNILAFFHETQVTQVSAHV